MDRDPSYSIRSRDLHDRIPGMQRGRGIRRCHTIACISADRPDVTDLRTSDHIYRFSQNIDMFLNDRIFRNMGKARERSDPYRSICFVRHTTHLIEHINAHQLFSGTFSLSHLYKHIASTCNDLCFRMFYKERNRMFYTLCFVKRFHILKSFLLPSSAGRDYVG